MEKKPLKKSLATKTKVVHLITLLELGGAQGNTLYTASHLDAHRYEVHLWSGKGAYWDKEAERKWSNSGHFRYFSRLRRPIHPLYDLLVIFDLVRALRKLKPEILHTHSSKAGIVGRVAGKIAGVPQIIHTFHGFGFNDEQKPWTKFFFVFIEKICAKFSTHLIFVSEANMKEARQLKIGRPETYVLIRSGIPLEDLHRKAATLDRNKIRRSLSIEGPLITTIGAFKPQKNLVDFVEVAKKVCDEIPEAHFQIIGDGEQRGLIERKIIEAKLENKISLLGWRQDVAALLLASDVFALTSLWEGLPRALLEAMTLGVPSVCYDTDGVRDILSKGGGYIVPKGHSTKAAEKIIEILKHKGLHQKLASEGKHLIAKEFDIDHMVHQLDAIYRGQPV